MHTEGDLYTGISSGSGQAGGGDGHLGSAGGEAAVDAEKQSGQLAVRAAREGKLAEVGKGQRLPSELELEWARTRKELADVKMEQDLPKKFATYSAKESR